MKTVEGKQRKAELQSSAFLCLFKMGSGRCGHRPLPEISQVVHLNERRCAATGFLRRKVETHTTAYAILRGCVSTLVQRSAQKEQAVIQNCSWEMQISLYTSHVSKRSLCVPIPTIFPSSRTIILSVSFTVFTLCDTIITV